MTGLVHVLAGMQKVRARGIRVADERHGLVTVPPGIVTIPGIDRKRRVDQIVAVLLAAIVGLDEPFAGIDPKAVYEIKQIIRRLADSGIGILITDHNVRDTLEITTTAHIISDGEILVSGTREELLANDEAREIYFGRDFDKGEGGR